MDFHGGNIYKIFREKNIKEILDYSSNINPYGVPESLKRKITENIGILERYPDPLNIYSCRPGLLNKGVE